MSLKFSWDRNKDVANSAKHGVDFQEALSVFRDRLAAIFDDEWHSDDEHRELIVGYSERSRLLIVVFTEREDSVRIISARKATRREVEAHEERRKQ